MKNSNSISKILDASSKIDDYQFIINYDQQEIDNPDMYHHLKINYLHRLNFILDRVAKLMPIPENVNIGDFACGQGNISLSLAEMGYDVAAIDINKKFIEYSKMKYEKGNVEWIVSEIDKLVYKEDIFDVAVAGEVIEHCAYPEEIIISILKFVKPGGFLIITTPNGNYFNSNLPTFSELSQKQLRKKF